MIKHLLANTLFRRHQNWLIGILLMFFFYTEAIALVTVNFRKIEHALTYPNIWDVTINNQEQGRRVIVLEGVILSREVGKVYEGRTGRFLLNPGQQIINFDNLPAMDLFFVQPDDNQIFKEGQYEISIRVLAFPELSLLGEERYTLVKSNSAIRDSISKNEKFAFNIDINASGQYTHTFGGDTTMQYYPEYGRLQVTPQVTLFEVPVIADFYISTENTQRLFRGSDQFNIRFDYNKFAQSLLNKNYEKLNAIVGQKIPYNDSILKQINKDYIKKQLPDVGDVLNQLENPEVLKQLKNYENLENLEKSIKDSGLKKGFESFQKEKAKYNLSSQDFYQLTKVLKDVDLEQVQKINEKMKLDFAGLNPNSNFYKNLYTKIQEVRDKDGLKDVKNPDKLLADLSLLSKLPEQSGNKKISELSNIQKKFSGFQVQEIRNLAELDVRLTYMQSNMGKNSLDNIKGIKKKDLKLIDNIEDIERLADYDLKSIETIADKLGLKKQLNTSSNSSQILMRMYDTLLVMHNVGSNVLENIKDKDKVLTDLRSLSRMRNDKLPDNWKEIIDAKKRFSKLSKTNLTRIKEKSRELKSVNLKENVLNSKELEKLKKYNQQISEYKNANHNQLLINPASLSSLDKAFNLLSKKDKILSSIKGLELGTMIPYVSELTLNGALVRGGRMIFDNNKLYFDVTGGKLDNFSNLAIYDTTLVPEQESDASKHVLGVSAGWGSKSANYCHVNYLFQSAKFVNESELNNEKEKSQVVSVDFGLQFSDKKYRIQGELARTFSGNVQSEDPYAFYLQTGIDLGGKKMTPFSILANVRYLGRDYYSAGIPLMIKDRFSYEIRLEKALFKEMILASLFYNEDQVNRSDNNKYQNFSTVGGSILFKKSQWPYWQISVAKILSKQYREYIEPSINSNYNINVNTGYDLKWKDKLFTIQLSYNNVYKAAYNYISLYQNGVNVIYKEQSFFSLHQVSARQMIRFKKKVDLQSSYSLIYPGKHSEDSNLLHICEVSSTIPIVKKLRAQLGILYVNEKKSNMKLGFFLQKIVDINKFIKFNIHVQKDIIHYNNLEQKDWTKLLIVRAVMIFRM